MPQVLLFGTSGNPPTGRDGHSGMVDYFVALVESPHAAMLCVSQGQQAYPHAHLPALTVGAVAVAAASAAFASRVWSLCCYSFTKSVEHFLAS